MSACDNPEAAPEVKEEPDRLAKFALTLFTCSEAVFVALIFDRAEVTGELECGPVLPDPEAGESSVR